MAASSLHTVTVTLVVLLSPVTVFPCVTGAWTTRCLWCKVGCLALQRCPCVSLYCIYRVVFCVNLTSFNQSLAQLSGWQMGLQPLPSYFPPYLQGQVCPSRVDPHYSCVHTESDLLFHVPLTSAQSQKFSHSQSATQPPTLLISPFPSWQARRGAVAAVFGII